MAIPFLKIRREEGTAALIGEQLFLKVTIPIETEVYGGKTVRDGIAMNVTDNRVADMPHLTSLIFSVDICGKSAPCIYRCWFAPQYLSSTGIAEVGTIRISLVYHIILKSGTAGVKVGKMLGVAMAETCRVKKGTVVVYRC